MFVNESLRKKVTVLTRICAQNKIGHSVDKDRLDEFKINDMQIVSDGLLVTWSMYASSSSNYTDEKVKLYWHDLEQLE